MPNGSWDAACGLACGVLKRDCAASGSTSAQMDKMRASRSKRRFIDLLRCEDRNRRVTSRVLRDGERFPTFMLRVSTFMLRADAASMVTPRRECPRARDERVTCRC